jgi:predicted PurR-regulated permease PerM
MNAVAPVIKTDSVSTNTTETNYQAMSNEQREAALMQKLSPDQLLELEKIRSRANSDDGNPLGTVGIVIISCMPFLATVLIVFFVMYYRRQKEQRFMALCEKAIEAGKDLPDNFFKKPQLETSSHLLKGMIWGGVGIGVTVGALFLMGFNSPWAFGFIPVFVGIAYIISYFLENRTPENEPKNE